MKLALTGGTTSVSLLVFIQDTTSTTGAGLTGLVFNTASLTAYYARPGAAATPITLATQTVAGAFSSGGFVEVSSANMPGVYRFDIPDAALAAGVPSVVAMLKGAANMAPLLLEIQIAPLPANVTQIDAAATSGNNATLNLKQLNIVNNAGSALVASSTGSGGHGIAASGNGTGHGISTTGGATGNGVDANGGATSGDGINAAATASNSDGMRLTGAGAGSGLQALGGVTGNGVAATGGNTSGHGLLAQASGFGSSPGHGIRAAGFTSGEGISAVGGATGHGIEAIGGATSGNGINAAATAGNGHGVNIAGQGSGHGINVTGGATGNGIDANGGATSGDGINAAATTSGDGMELVGAGGGFDLNATTTDNLEVNATTGGGLTAQQTRDAMKLAPTVGAADPGSIDDLLQNITTISSIYPDLLATGVISALTSQTEFDLDGSGSPDDNAYVGNVIVITAAANARQKAVGVVRTYTAATKTVELEGDPGIFTMATGDLYDVLAFGDGLSAVDVRAAIGMASANLDTQLNALPTATENADALLKRDWTAITGEAARSALNALRAIRNRVRINAGTMTIYSEDDATPIWTAPVTTDAAALPIIEIDPT